MNFRKNLYVLTKTQNRFGIVKNQCCYNSEWMNNLPKLPPRLKDSRSTHLLLWPHAHPKDVHITSDFPVIYHNICFSDFHKQCFHA